MGRDQDAVGLPDHGPGPANEWAPPTITTTEKAPTTKETMMGTDEKARLKAADPKIAREIQTLGGLVQIYCADHHVGRERTPYAGFGVECGCYAPQRVPDLCPECAAHLAYGERRRALCVMDPKPSCHACPIHCYRKDEAAWQREVMRYSGPRSMVRGMFVEGFQHLLSEIKSRKINASYAQAKAAKVTARVEAEKTTAPDGQDDQGR